MEPVDGKALLRKLSVQFLEEAVETLEQLREDLDNFPDSQEAMRDWLTELCQLSRRATDLCVRWRKMAPELELAQEGDVPRHMRKTPFELP
jgi:hypothetical protein